MDTAYGSSYKGQTIRQQTGSHRGFLSDFRGRTSACFPLIKECSISPPAKREALHSLEPKACRLMSLCSYRPAKPRRIRTDSKHSLRLFDMSFLLVTRLLNSKISLVPTAIPKNIKKRQEKFLPFLGLRKLSGFVSEGSSSLCLRFHYPLKLHRSNLSF